METVENFYLETSWGFARSLYYTLLIFVEIGNYSYVWVTKTTW